MSTLSNENPLVNRSIPFLFWGDISEFPSLPGVYCMFEHLDSDPHLNYIGQTKNFARRMLGHRVHNIWTTEAIVRFMPISDPIIRTITERWLIAYHCPPANRHRYIPSSLGYVDNEDPLALRNLHLHKWGNWQYDHAKGWLRLTVPKSHKNVDHSYCIHTRGRFDVSEVTFDIENMAGMRLGRYLPDFHSAASIIFALQRRGRDRATISMAGVYCG